MHLVIYSSKPIDFAPFKLIDKSTLNKVSKLTNASSIIGVFKIPKSSNRFNTESFSLALDSVSDPGNLGTIIRLSVIGLESMISSVVQILWTVIIKK